MTQDTPGAAAFLPLAEPWLDEDCAEAVKAQVLSSFVGPGAACREFSESIQAFIGARHCVLTTSGTIALSVAAKSLGLKTGDEILLPAYGVISTIDAFTSIGLKPRLVDVEKSTGCMDPAHLEKRITPMSKGICFVDFSGYTGETALRTREIALKHGIPLIEDAACAFGHKYAGRYAGTFGLVGTLSFSVPKVLTTGQGGAVITDSTTIATSAREYIDHGDLSWRETNLNRNIGTNLRFNDVLAALGLSQLRSIEERLERKRLVYSTLRDMLRGRLYASPDAQAPLHNIVFTKEPDRLVSTLRAAGVGAVRQYRSLYQHPPYAQLGDDHFAGAEFWTNHAVYLPFGLALSGEDARRLGSAVMGSGVELLPAAV